jgi:Protein of unknown function (DUF2735)
MAMTPDRDTAKIFEFPPQPRATAILQRLARESKIPGLTTQPTTTDFGDCWYHEAAITSEDVPRKR